MGGEDYHIRSSIAQVIDSKEILVLPLANLTKKNKNVNKKIENVGRYRFKPIKWKKS